MLALGRLRVSGALRGFWSSTGGPTQFLGSVRFVGAL